MIKAHVDNHADVTIAVLEVPIEEASRFGIMSVDEESRITRFAEKPKNPDSTLASMGIYVFSWEVLRDALIVDEANPGSENDFGKNVIPKLLDEKKRLFAHRFRGYWKDVGTIDSYYSANMEMLGQCPSFDLYKKTYKIISNSDADARPPQYIGPKAHVKNSIISNGCRILGHVENSIISPGVVVEEGARVENAILFPDVTVEKNALVWKAILGETVVVGESSAIGTPNSLLDSGENAGEAYEPNGITIVENGTKIKAGSRILAGSEITLQEGV